MLRNKTEESLHQIPVHTITELFDSPIPYVLFDCVKICDMCWSDIIIIVLAYTGTTCLAN